MKGGKHFYKTERSKYFAYDSRPRVDRFLIRRLQKKYKNRLYSLDSGLFEIAKINCRTPKDRRGSKFTISLTCFH